MNSAPDPHVVTREDLQLAMGRDLLAHAKDVLSVPRQPSHVLRYTCERLTESLGDVLRVGEVRGERLAAAGGPRKRGPISVSWGSAVPVEGEARTREGGGPV